MCKAMPAIYKDSVVKKSLLSGNGIDENKLTTAWDKMAYSLQKDVRNSIVSAVMAGLETLGYKIFLC